MRLTPRQKAILDRVNSRNIDANGAESGPEMAMALWDTGVFTSCEQGQRSCKQLVAKGLLLEVGYDENYARCYGPNTPTKEPT